MNFKVKAWMESIEWRWSQGGYWVKDGLPVISQDLAAEMYRMSEVRVAEARIDERNIAIQELRDELEKVRSNKALTPDGINGYWSAIRDFSLNNGDRIVALAATNPRKES